MKNKSNSTVEKGYHHFVSPLKMNKCYYKAYIMVKQKQNSNIYMLFQLFCLNSTIL